MKMAAVKSAIFLLKEKLPGLMIGTTDKKIIQAISVHIANCNAWTALRKFVR